MEIVTEQLTHLRLGLDKIFKSLEEDGEHFMAQHSVKLAFMWLGKAKGIAGSANPYPESTDASSKRIEPAVDQYEGDLVVNTDEIAFIKTMRSELDTVENNIRNGLMPYMHANRFFQKALENSWTHVCEAKMFLGLALGEIRDQQGPQEKKETPTPQETPPSATPEQIANFSKESEPETPPAALTADEASAQAEAAPAEGKAATPEASKE